MTTCATSSAALAVGQSRSEALTGIIGAAPGVHGLDDLSAVDALEVDAGDAEVAVPELALDDDQRDAFSSHLDGVGVPYGRPRLA